MRRPPVAAEPHGQLAVPVGYQFVTCARTRSANARATTVGRDAVIATSGFIREPSRLEIRDATSAGGDRDPDTERKDAGDFGARRHRCARYKKLDRTLGPHLVNS